MTKPNQQGEDHRSQPAMAGEFFSEIQSVDTAIAGGWVQKFGQEAKFTANHMNPSITSTTPTRRKLPLIFGIIIFGILMGIREDFATRWQRALVAATAAVVLGASVVQYRKAQ